MATNKRDLKAYVRFDGTGRIVPGSLVLRRSKPKNGNWKETQAYECCDTLECVVPSVTLLTTVRGFPVNTESGCIPITSFYCNENDVLIIDIRLFGLPDNCTLEQYIEILNSRFSWIGIWSFVETTITLEMNGAIGKALCSEGELSIQTQISCPA
jgi:hypothetical protein